MKRKPVTQPATQPSSTPGRRHYGRKEAKASVSMLSRVADLAVDEIVNPRTEMEEAIDNLFILFRGGTTCDKIAEKLMLLFHRASKQDDVVAEDCMRWAVLRCFHWTLRHNEACDAYLASLLEEQGE